MINVSVTKSDKVIDMPPAALQTFMLCMVTEGSLRGSVFIKTYADSDPRKTLLLYLSGSYDKCDNSLTTCRRARYLHPEETVTLSNCEP